MVDCSVANAPHWRMASAVSSSLAGLRQAYRPKQPRQGDVTCYYNNLSTSSYSVDVSYRTWL